MGVYWKVLRGTTQGPLNQLCVNDRKLGAEADHGRDLAETLHDDSRKIHTLHNEPAGVG